MTALLHAVLHFVPKSKQILLISLLAPADARTPQVAIENSNKGIWNTI